MPKPRKTLDAALGRATPAPASITETVETPEAEAQVPTNVPAASKRNRRTPKLSVYLSDEVHRQLREIAHVEYPTKLNDLILEGLDRVFKDRGRPSIEELDSKAG